MSYTSTSLVSILATGSRDMTAIPPALKPVVLAISGRLAHNNNNVVLFKSLSFVTVDNGVELTANKAAQLALRISSIGPVSTQANQICPAYHFQLQESEACPTAVKPRVY